MHDISVSSNCYRIAIKTCSVIFSYLRQCGVSGPAEVTDGKLVRRKMFLWKQANMTNIELLIWIFIFTTIHQKSYLWGILSSSFIPISIVPSFSSYQNYGRKPLLRRVFYITIQSGTAVLVRLLVLRSPHDLAQFDFKCFIGSEEGKQANNC